MVVSQTGLGIWNHRQNYLMKNLFILSCSYYESYVDYYFEGSETTSQEDFNKICDSFLDEAAYKALSKEVRHKDFVGTVGWVEIVESLSSILEKHGFKQFTPKRVTYWGGGGINTNRDAGKLRNSVSAIIKHNLANR